MYCAISFLNNDNAGLFGLIALLIILVVVVTLINIKVDQIKNRKVKEFEDFLIRYDERQGLK